MYNNYNYLNSKIPDSALVLDLGSSCRIHDPSTLFGTIKDHF
jgi:hypothetical protein